MNSKCQICNKEYKVDIHVDDKLWEEIKPKGKAVEAGMICGVCIVNAIENKNQYNSYTLKKDW